MDPKSHAAHPRWGKPLWYLLFAAANALFAHGTHALLRYKNLHEEIVGYYVRQKAPDEAFAYVVKRLGDMWAFEIYVSMLIAAMSAVFLLQHYRNRFYLFRSSGALA